MKRPVIIIWDQLSAYHVDRLRATGSLLEGQRRVIAIEIASSSDLYAWEEVSLGNETFEKLTLFPGQRLEAVSSVKRLARLLKICSRFKGAVVLLGSQHRPEMRLASVVLRLRGHHLLMMIEAKFDDHPRRALTEALKTPFLKLFCGGLYGGRRHREYHEFLGMAPERLVRGYDTVSVDRIRAMGDGTVFEVDVPHEDRPFIVVARFVDKKNLEFLLSAYGEYARTAQRPRDLVLCGSGPLEEQLRGVIKELGLEDKVNLPGFLDPEEVARVMARSFALLIPSVEEQWGLVVNEGVAVGLPVISSLNVGARDHLLRSGLNGFIVEDDNVDGWVEAMKRLDADRSLWIEMARNSLSLAFEGDTKNFAAGLQELLERC